MQAAAHITTRAISVAGYAVELVDSKLLIKAFFAPQRVFKLKALGDLFTETALFGSQLPYGVIIPPTWTVPRARRPDRCSSSV